tara:strand:- start:1277 stop:2896 length:1620 start_codon:yes stop_codon:yes gene_type:complete
MGIPSFFAQLVRKHGNCIKIINNNTIIDYLFLDANSIIYDCVHKLLKTTNLTLTSNNSKDNEKFESELYAKIVEKIKNYINTLNPEKLIFIAFDGNPPVAKLKQQRTRRYKSIFNKKIIDKLKETDNTNNTNNKEWDTTKITPGTDFMNGLMKYIDINLIQKSKKDIILSSSNEIGEGEHKIFNYIRENKFNHTDYIVVYGLDADLIMLSLNHLDYCNNINLFRETPEFISQIDSDLEPNKLYNLDIFNFGEALTFEMNSKTAKNKNIYNDYIFLCFLLGNDFIPHTPSINIRKNGIDILLNAYKYLFKDTNNFLIVNRKIQWKNVRKLLMHLGINEKERMIEEEKCRKKYSKIQYTLNNNDIETKIKKFDILPSYSRESEKYINPFIENWETRYYEELFNINDTENIKNVCINYFEALEWTFEYYTIGCKDWRWKYNYNYAPLINDMIKYVSYFNIDYVKHCNNKPLTTQTQLSYVLPFESLYLLDDKIKNYLLKNYDELYKNHMIQWSYCKYFWESHVIFPEINLENFEQEINKITN